MSENIHVRVVDEQRLMSSGIPVHHSLMDVVHPAWVTRIQLHSAGVHSNILARKTNSSPLKSVPWIVSLTRAELCEIPDQYQFAQAHYSHDQFISHAGELRYFVVDVGNLTTNQFNLRRAALTNVLRWNSRQKLRLREGTVIENTWKNGLLVSHRWRPATNDGGATCAERRQQVILVSIFSDQESIVARLWVVPLNK